MQNLKNNESDRSISISRLVNAPIQLVWEVWTKPEHIKNWWGPNGFTNTITKMEVKPGGEWNLVMHSPDGTEFKNKSVFKEIVKHRKLVYEHISAPKFIATIEFEDRGDKTFIQWKMLFESEEQLIRVIKTFKADEGLKQNIEKLENFLQDQLESKDNENVSTFSSGYSTVNGIKMYYEIHGTGKPLVLIHGGGSTIQTSFGRILPLLAKNRQTIAVELQAHGRTEDRNSHSSFEQDADDVTVLLHNLNISKADVLGFSNGGNTAMQVAIRNPEIVDKLIIASSFYKRDGMYKGFWEGMHKAEFSDMPQPYKDEFLKINNDPGALMKMFERDAHRMQTFNDWSDKDIQSITAPTLLILGDRDVMIPEHAVAMFHLIPNCKLAIIPGGHGKYLGEMTTLSNGKWTQDYVTALIEQFLDGEL